MMRSTLIEQVKQAILEIEPSAEIILYGSRSRGDFNEESDWDFLILVEGTVDDKRIDNIRHRLYEVEWQQGQVISSITRSHQEWDSPRYQVMPLHQRIEQEGIKL